MTFASGKVNLQSRHDRICNVAKVKAVKLAHSMADPILSIKLKEKILYTTHK